MDNENLSEGTRDTAYGWAEIWIWGLDLFIFLVTHGFCAGMKEKNQSWRFFLDFSSSISAIGEKFGKTENVQVTAFGWWWRRAPFISQGRLLPSFTTSSFCSKTLSEYSRFSSLGCHRYFHVPHNSVTSSCKNQGGLRPKFGPWWHCRCSAVKLVIP